MSQVNIFSKKMVRWTALCIVALAAAFLDLSGEPARHLAQRQRHEELLTAQEDLMRSGDSRLSGRLFSLDPDTRRSYRLTATAYCPECGVSEGVTQPTALTGRPVRPGRTVAVSRDLRRLLGRTVYIEGLGLRVVEDLMHARHVGRMDLCLPDREKAQAFGVRRLDMVVMD